MDPLKRATLQADISKTMEKARKHDDVVGVLNEAQKALNARQWAKAQELYGKALSIFTPNVKVVDILVDTKAAISRAQARRLIASGVVFVDGVQLRKDTAEVGPDQEVKVKQRKKTA